MVDDFPDSTKAGLRSRIRAARLARAEDARTTSALALAEHVLALPEVMTAATVALYMSLPTEPGTAPLLDALLDAGRNVLLPGVFGESLIWTRVTRATQFAPGAYGIDEPISDDHVDLSLADVIVVPALAVDLHGVRLGQGGGFYDRALAQLDRPTVALVFDDEVFDDEVVDSAAGNGVPRQAHDCRVDVIVTPQRTLRIS